MYLEQTFLDLNRYQMHSFNIAHVYVRSIAFLSFFMFGKLLHSYQSYGRDEGAMGLKRFLYSGYPL